MKIKVSAICSAEATVAALNTPDPNQTDAVVSAQLGSAQTLSSVLRNDMPDVVLLDFPVADEHAMVQIETALIQAPGTHLVLVSPDRSVELLMRAMRAGVREVVPTPLSSATLLQVIEHVQAKQLINADHLNSDGCVIALIPAKGGAGATFLACNLAYALSKLGKRVALLDLNLYFGDAAIFLGDKPVVSSIIDLARQAERLDAALLNSSMVKVNEHLHLLAAAESPDDANAVSVVDVGRIIELARSEFDFVLLDVSGTFDPVVIKALDMADTICLTLQLNLPFIRAAKHMASVFRQLGYAREKLNVIVNRFEKDGVINLVDVERATLLKVGRTIPNSHTAVTASVNEGIPLLELAPRDPVAHALQAWAQDLAPTAVGVNANWWQRLTNSST